MKHEELRDALFSLPELAEQESESACYKVLESFLREFTAERSTLSDAEDITEMQRFRNIVLPVVLESSLCRYIYEKPRGYAGDFMTQEMIWFGRTLGGSNRYEGNTKAGRLLNSLILDAENCRANEARIRYFRKMGESATRIASIGSGSAIDFWECNRLDVDILLLDMDQGALDRAKEKLNTQLSVTYTCQNILKFCLGRKKPDCYPDRNLVYASGLFDYFDLAASRRIADGIWRMVLPGGELVITNAEIGNPTRLWMEYGGDWFLQYKTQEQMAEIAEGLADVKNFEVMIDEFGVYQYLHIKKND